jgi:hypothetical protein
MISLVCGVWISSSLAGLSHGAVKEKLFSYEL